MTYEWFLALHEERGITGRIKVDFSGFFSRYLLMGRSLAKTKQTCGSLSPAVLLSIRVYLN